MFTPLHTPIKSQNDKVKEHMLAGHTIDTWQAYKLYTITCLAQRIYDLKQAGVSISSKIITRNGKTFSIYWIEAGCNSLPATGHNNAIEGVSSTDVEIACNDK
ncbi:helix-turn-helix domain-containing protein [Psychrobacter sp.]|uniref:helix-turn-helix domain-containing protein n=1 Tax=Psychrobacter sp. TaxID=56811 RepID=UPI003562F442